MLKAHRKLLVELKRIMEFDEWVTLIANSCELTVFPFNPRFSSMDWCPVRNQIFSCEMKLFKPDAKNS